MTHALNDLIAQYRGHAEQHGRATATGDHKAANQHHDALLGVLAKIRQCGDVGGAALSTLLNDDDAAVRCWAATHCLGDHEAIAVAALEKLVEAKAGIVSFNAKMVLREWRGGRLEGP